MILVVGALTLAAGPALAAEGGKGPSEVIFIAQLAALMLTGRKRQCADNEDQTRSSGLVVWKDRQKCPRAALVPGTH